MPWLLLYYVFCLFCVLQYIKHLKHPQTYLHMPIDLLFVLESFSGPTAY